MKWIAHHLLLNQLFPLGLRFMLVYRLDLWRSSSLPDADTGAVLAPRSGPGSAVSSTTHLRTGLSQTARRLFGAQDTLRIVDAPCGDMTWMPLFINDLAMMF